MAWNNYPDAPTISPDDHADTAGTVTHPWNPETGTVTNPWGTGKCPFRELINNPQPQWQAHSDVRLALITHIAAPCHELRSLRLSRLTLWTEQMLKYVIKAALFMFFAFSLVVAK